MSKIESISLQTGKKGKFYKLKADGRNYTAFDNTEAFKQLNEDLFQIDDDVKLDYTEVPGEFDGKPITYKNLKKITLLESADGEENEREKVNVQTNNVRAAKPSVGNQFPNRSDDYWDDKEARIIMQNSLKHATDWVSINAEALREKCNDDKTITPTTVIGVAKEYFEAVWAARKPESGK